MGEESKKKAILEVETLFGRVSRLEDVREALEHAVAVCKDRMTGMEAVIRSEERGGLKYLQEGQDNLDRITLPKIDNDMQDLEKRLSQVERYLKRLQKRGRLDRHG